MSDKLQVWSCGGGTQSCAIGALIIQGKLPKPDIAIIADTGRETETTWDYFSHILFPNLLLSGVDIIRIPSKDWSYYDGVGIFTPKGDLLLPVYSTESGEGKLPAACSKAWKTDVVTRWLSVKKGITRSQFIKWVGFSRDEILRIIKMKKSPEWEKGLLRFPLLELNITRRECVLLVKQMGWPTPPRSACWMCPNHSPEEWRDIKQNRPDEFQKAVELERDMQKVDPDAWLHRSCVPLDQVDFSQPEDLFSRPCDSGMCFV